jgi:hypothetical protein
MMIGVPEKYALEVSSPTPITSERQHEQYLSVMDKLASKDNPTTEEEKSFGGPDGACLVGLSLYPLAIQRREDCVYCVYIHREEVTDGDG